MGFYDISENIDKYIDMCDGYDGSNIYKELTKFVIKGSTLLELGSGPGFDIAFLNDHYDVIGSDLSDEFLTRLKSNFTNIPFLKVDAENINLDRKFDCIYSNKVLHHLTKDKLKVSLSSQWEALSKGGRIAHTFWIGEEDQEMEGLLFTYYRKEELLDFVSKKFNILSTMSYSEFEEADSLLIIAEKLKR